MTIGRLLGRSSAAGVSVFALGLVASRPLHLKQAKEKADIDAARTDDFIWRNWSSNHEFSAKRTWKPATIEELEAIVNDYHERGERLCIVGSGLSPNGVGFGRDGGVALCLERLNHVVFIDEQRRIAKFESGMTVGQVVEELASHGLALENLASINLQQLGGFYQVGAHGTGAGIPPVDEQVLEMTLVTPGKGRLILSPSSNPEIFRMAKVGLGALGVITDFTVRCVALHNLREETRVVSRKELRVQHSRIVRENKHVKYMWIPFEDSVVVVTANETTEPVTADSGPDHVKAMKKMHELFSLTFPNRPVPIGMNFADFRTVLLEKANLCVEHVRNVNKAEASYHKSMQGSMVKRMDDTMAFDCGGQQLVLEMATRVGDDKHNAGTRDVDFILALLDRIESEKLPAPVPIEHRFTSGSTAALSQAPGKGVFGWIGIVLYLPSVAKDERDAVKKEFARYGKVALDLAKEMGIEMRVHWAKLEIPTDREERRSLKQELERLYPLRDFRRIKDELDPKGILGGVLVESILSST